MIKTKHTIPVKAINSVILGAPGGGKGTISKKIIKEFDVQHVSTGDILRSNIANGTKIGNLASDYINKGFY
jgi:adenylate kinase